MQDRMRHGLALAIRLDCRAGEESNRGRGLRIEID